MTPSLPLCISCGIRALLVPLILCAGGFAQTASVSGTVADTGGGVMPGVRVVLSSAGDAELTTSSGASGE